MTQMTGKQIAVTTLKTLKRDTFLRIKINRQTRTTLSMIKAIFLYRASNSGAVVTAFSLYIEKWAWFFTWLALLRPFW